MRSNRSRRWAHFCAVTCALAGLLATVAACTQGAAHPRPSFAGPAYTLRVLGSSELADMTPILQAAAKATGVAVKLTPIGSLAGTQAVIDGKADGHYDAIWFASDAYLALHPGALARLDGTTEIMSSPVILGLRSSAAHRLGWDTKPVTWGDIAAAAARHEFTFGMTDPAKSNSGLSALVGVATAIAGNGAALQPGEVAPAMPQLAGFFHAQTLTADSSGWLTKSYLHELASGRAPSADGLIDYESQLLALNAASPPHEPVTLIYPSDGVIPADYPLSILASAPPAAKNAYQRLTRYLQTPQAQREIMRVTHRRPIIGGIGLTRDLAAHKPFELPFPGKLATITALIHAYDNALRRPGRTLYVLDTSGSMAGARIAGLKRALGALTGTDTSLTGQFSQFRNGEQITFLPFSTAPGTPTVFNVPASGPQPVLQQIRSYINALTAGGNTAIYDSLADAYQIIAAQHAADPKRIESIVLLTDGENNTGRDLTGFTAYYRHLPPGSPPVFTIIFGEADKAAMNKLAAITGGLTFDATSQPPSALTAIFEQLRSYQ